MSLWPFTRRKEHKRKIEALEEAVRAERGNLALSIVNFERADNALDQLVRQHLELLRGQNDRVPH